MYNVCLIGFNKARVRTDYCKCLSNFDELENAIEYMNGIWSVSQVCSIKPYDSKTSLIEVSVTDTENEIVTCRTIEWIPKRRKYVCPHCGGFLFATKTNGYFAQCFECDEDFYKFECKEGKGE